MVTIQIHVSDETAEALAEWSKTHNKVVAVVRADIALQIAKHPDECTDATCPDLVRIAATQEHLRVIECVSRFAHDVISAAKCAARS